MAPKDTKGGYQSRPGSPIPDILATLPPEFEGGFWKIPFKIGGLRVVGDIIGEMLIFPPVEKYFLIF